MDNLYLYNEVDGLGPAKDYVASRVGPKRLEDVGLTLVHPFYNEKSRFEKQVEIWKGWSSHVRDCVQIIVVDDGSPNPVQGYITPKIEEVLNDLNFSIQRIKQDLKWNTPGALNVGLIAAHTNWVLIMDSDCAFDNENMEKLLKADPETFAVYKFPRLRVGVDGDPLENTRYLPCTMLFHESVFWDKLGGFDEDFTGEYSTGYAFFDTDFDDRAFKLVKDTPMFVWNTITATEWMPSIAGGEIVSRSKKEEKVNRKLWYKKQGLREKSCEVRNPSPILRFDYEEVYHNDRS